MDERLTRRRMDGQQRTDGWMNGLPIHGRTDGWTATDGRTERCVFVYILFPHACILEFLNWYIMPTWRTSDSLWPDV